MYTNSHQVKADDISQNEYEQQILLWNDQMILWETFLVKMTVNKTARDVYSRISNYNTEEIH